MKGYFSLDHFFIYVNMAFLQGTITHLSSTISEVHLARLLSEVMQIRFDAPIYSITLTFGSQILLLFICVCVSTQAASRGADSLYLPYLHFPHWILLISLLRGLESYLSFYSSSKIVYVLSAFVLNSLLLDRPTVA